jgi:hypothetical protein
MPIMLLSFADQALVPKTTLIETNFHMVNALFHWFLGSRKEEFFNEFSKSHLNTMMQSRDPYTSLKV